MISVNLKPELESLLLELAEKAGETPSSLAQKAVVAYLEDLEDYADAVAALKECDPAETVSLEEMKRELGMEA